MALSEQDIQIRLRKRVPAEMVLVEDESGGCGSKFNVVVVSSAFEGMSLIDRQRKVNDSLKEEMKIIHALSMKTWTFPQWEQRKDTLPPLLRNQPQYPDQQQTTADMDTS